MPGRRFDRLAISLWDAGSRRELVRLLTTAPVLGALTALLGSEEGEAAHPANRVLRRKEQRRRKARKARREQRDQKENQHGNEGAGPPQGGNTCTPLNNTCIIGGNPCCANTGCFGVGPALFGLCDPVQSCTTDADCASQFPGQDVACTKHCLDNPLEKCCGRKVCSGNADCGQSGLCCGGSCCANGQSCTLTGCFGGIDG
jgi:hypothetical protein